MYAVPADQWSIAQTSATDPPLIPRRPDAKREPEAVFRVGLGPGTYVLVPQASEGLMGTAAPEPFTVADGVVTPLEGSYDTGIR